MSERILVLAAHPDDEVLGCGGMMARKAAEGAFLRIVILGEGLTSRPQSHEAVSGEALDRLRQCSRRAAEILGVANLVHYGMPDNRMDTMPLIEVIRLIEKEVQDFRPTTVYTQHGGDLNIDHVITFRATMTALRPMQGGSVSALLAYEVGSSSEYSFRKFSPEFTPDFFVDISEFVESKIAAMQAYDSEARPYPHPRSPEAIRATAMRWGANVGVKAAEAFETVWRVE